MGENKYAQLPDEVPATALVQLVPADDPVPLGPEGGGDAD